MRTITSTFFMPDAVNASSILDATVAGFCRPASRARLPVCRYVRTSLYPSAFHEHAQIGHTDPVVLADVDRAEEGCVDHEAEERA